MKENNVPTAAELKRLQNFILWCQENNVDISEIQTAGISMAFNLGPSAAAEVIREVPSLPTRQGDKEALDSRSIYQQLYQNRTK